MSGLRVDGATRNALIEGTLSLVIAPPLDQFGKAAIETMLRMRRVGVDMGNHMVCRDFAVYTPEIV